uniref:Integral membrane protein n=1 Tax=Schlesneria paludicola TaxID=360056 RepID=A0A7C4QVV6_9PLAN
MVFEVMAQTAALLFALISAGVGAFQMALTLGAPLGEFTLGGRWRGRLPLRVRLIPMVSVLLLGIFSAVILARAGLGLPAVQEHSRPLAWVVVGYFVLGCIANAITPSKRERMLWLPVVLVMLLLSLTVASS